MIRLTKEFSFESAHALWGYDGKCREVHGHSYRLFVTIKGEPITDQTDPKLGMVMDFGELKSIVAREITDRLDHSFVMRRTPEAEALAESMRDAGKKLYLVSELFLRLVEEASYLADEVGHKLLISLCVEVIEAVNISHEV